MRKHANLSMFSHLTGATSAINGTLFKSPTIGTLTLNVLYKILFTII